MTVIAINHYQLTPDEDEGGEPSPANAGEAAFFNL